MLFFLSKIENSVTNLTDLLFCSLFLPSRLCLCSLSTKKKIIRKLFILTHSSPKLVIWMIWHFLTTIRHVTAVFTSVLSLIRHQHWQNFSPLWNWRCANFRKEKDIKSNVWSAVRQISTALAPNADWLFRIYTHISASILVPVLYLKRSTTGLVISPDSSILVSCHYYDHWELTAYSVFSDCRCLNALIHIVNVSAFRDIVKLKI